MAFDPSTVAASSATAAPEESRPAIRHHCWTYPYSTKSGGNPVYDASHPLWAVDGFAPIARVSVDNLTAPPGSSTTYAATAAGAAEAVADHIAYVKAATEAAGRSLTSYGFFLQNWGNPHESDPTADRTNTYALLRNWADRVTGGTVADANAVHNPYSANGIAALQAWTIDYLNALGAQLESRSLPAPTDLHWDWEAVYLVASFVPVPDGSWPRIIADARYTTELVDGESTFADLYAAGRSSTGDALSVDTAKSIYNATNNEWAAWQLMAMRRVCEWALDQSLYGPARAKFPGIACGNYDFQPRTPAQTWWKVDKAYAPRTTSREWPMRNSDYAVPNMYPLPDSAIDANGSSNLAGWLALYNLTASGSTSTDLRNLWKAHVKNNIRALATYTDLTISPWMPFPGYAVTYTNAGNTTITATMDDLYELGEFCAAEMGIRDQVWWMNESLLDSMDEYTDLLRYLNSRVPAMYGATRTAQRRRSRRRT